MGKSSIGTQNEIVKASTVRKKRCLFGVSRKAARMIYDIFGELASRGESENFLGREQYGLYLCTLKFWDGCDEKKWIEQCENIDADPKRGINIESFALLYTKWKRPLPADHSVIMADLRQDVNAQSSDEYAAAMKAILAVASGRKHYVHWDYCVVCGEEHHFAENPIVFCDGCDIAVHKECYGAPLINGIPEDEWLCDACIWDIPEDNGNSSRTCVLCPVKGGAMKRTTDFQWMHIACGLWIPEVFFINGEALEPIDYFKVPASRFDMVCEYCGKSGPDVGACFPCSWSGCTSAFHICCGLHSGRDGGASVDFTEALSLSSSKSTNSSKENNANIKNTLTTCKKTNTLKPKKNCIHLNYTPGKNGQAAIIVGYCSVHAKRAKRTKSWTSSRLRAGKSK